MIVDLPKKICCVGEPLLRFSPAGRGAWIHDASMAAFIGGAELNVALALTNWQLPVRYGTALPPNGLADDVIEHIASKGVDTSAIVRTGQRMGSYYVPQGSDTQSKAVIYDRAHSAFAGLIVEDIDLDALLEGVSWLHVSAISPALSITAAELCQDLVVAAAGRGLTVSIDLNYRPSLWQYGVPPTSVMPGIVSFCDVIMGNLWSASDLLGVPIDEALIADRNREGFLAHAQFTADALMARYPRCKAVAQTFRFDEPTGLRYFAALNTTDQLNATRQYVTATQQVDSVVSRIGSGDCFMAGLIYGFSRGLAPQAIVDFAAQAAIGKFREPGDVTNQSVDEITGHLSTQPAYS